MQISERLSGESVGRLALAAMLAFLFVPGAAFSFDVKEEAKPQAVERGTLFKSVGDSIRAGIRALSSGDPGSAVEPLTYAAREGNVAAQWKLGRMYAEGQGVRRDDIKAFQHFSQIVNRHADESPDSPHARVVAQAFVALGSYHLHGIPNSRIRRDPQRAAEMFHYAAAFYNDADGQYHMGRILADGLVGPKDLPQAARWFNLAAEKGHPLAQAHLGRMLFNGDGVPRQAPRGLMWMQIASERADPAREAWVRELNDRARLAASEDERKLSEAYARRLKAAERR